MITRSRGKGAPSVAEAPLPPEGGKPHRAALPSAPASVAGSGSSRSSVTIRARLLAAQATHARKKADLERAALESERAGLETERARAVRDSERAAVDLELEAQVAAIEAEEEVRHSGSQASDVNRWLEKAEQCVAVNIKKVEVPALVEVGAKTVILDCEFTTGEEPEKGLVMKWFFNGSSGLVYQWIPPLRPQVIGLLKGKVDMNFRISDEPLQAYRAVKILNPTTDLSGNYTCVVSTFMEEDRQTRPMLVYSPGKNFLFYQEKKYVFLVTLICVAEDLYPKPVMNILSKGKPLQQAETVIKMDSWGLYTVTTTALVHDDDVTSPYEEFTCSLDLPPANYTVNRTTIYYPGLMPTAYIAAVEMEKHQERQANNCRGMLHSSSVLYDTELLIAIMIIIQPCFNNM